MPDVAGKTLPWPPRKEDLERLYLSEKLSAARIASVYGLRYKNLKVAESTVLYQLKRNGIPRRDKAELARKVTAAIEDEWIRRYQAGESLKQISAGLVSPATVWNHLTARGLVLRDKVEAQIKAVTKYERRPFAGDKVERAYLMGLRYGDLHVLRHGRAIRVRVSTTHLAMADLFYSLFSPYGHVQRYPRRAKLVGYEWTLECDLDGSFGFLLRKLDMPELRRLRDVEFLAFLAGFFDAEGSIYIHRKPSGTYPELSVNNTDMDLLKLLRRDLIRMGFHPGIRRQMQVANRIPGVKAGEIWSLTIWRVVDVQKLLAILQFKHQEKVTKARLVSSFLDSPLRFDELERAWKDVTNAIARDRLEFVNRARTLVEGGSSIENAR